MTLRDKSQLEAALNNWRERLLAYLQREISRASQDARDAEDGLGIAHRNPGQVAEDVIAILWDRLRDGSTRMSRLGRISDHVAEMELPELVVLFSRTAKVDVRPWEDEAWTLPSTF